MTRKNTFFGLDFYHSRSHPQKSDLELHVFRDGGHVRQLLERYLAHQRSML
jgi:hypothetical protein